MMKDLGIDYITLKMVDGSTIQFDKNNIDEAIFEVHESDVLERKTHVYLHFSSSDIKPVIINKNETTNIYLLTQLKVNAHEAAP